MSAQNVVTLQQAAPMARWICLDIETGDPDSQAIEAAIASWKPPSNVKDEAKIEARREEAKAKIRESGALLDAAPVLCVAIKTDVGAVVFSGMGSHHRPDIDGWHVVALDDERTMLLALTAYLDSVVGPETIICGFNIMGFDAPKIRHSFVRNRLPMPQCFRVGDQLQPMFDVMKKFRFFSVEHSDALFVSLDTVAASFGIQKPKSVVSGADVPRMHKEGKASEILVYCCIDTETTAEIYSAMNQ